MLRMIRFVIFGSRKGRSKKMEARKRMKRVQKIMMHQRLHDAQRNRASSAGGRQTDSLGREVGKPKRGGAKRKVKKKWEDKIGKIDKAENKQKMNEKKQRHEGALKRAGTLRERVKQSKQQGSDLWASL